MAQTIKIKNSVTTTSTPSSLVQGELAVNITDKKMWVGNAATTPILLLQKSSQYILEDATVSATAATGTVNYNLATQSVLYYTTNASGNWTLNIRGDGSTTLNSLLSTGQSVTCTFLVTQGSTAYYNSAVTIDGTSVTPLWQGGIGPASGSTNSVDVYTYAIIKTADATFKVFASQTQFA